MRLKGEFSMIETWKPIKDYEHYEVSNLGRVRNRQKHVLKQQTNKNHGGTKSIKLYKNGTSKRIDISRLVAIAFLDNPFDFKFVTHINNVDDNTVSNLRWASTIVH